MSLIKRRDSYNTGVVQFDQEHHKLVALVDVMFHAIRDKSTREVVAQASAELVAYTTEHFVHEEQAMEAVAYPGLQDHKNEHARLRAKAEQFRARIEQNDPEAALQFYHFLRDWLITHIQVTDKAYGSVLKEWNGM